MHLNQPAYPFYRCDGVLGHLTAQIQPVCLSALCLGHGTHNPCSYSLHGFATVLANVRKSTHSAWAFATLAPCP